VSQSPTSGASPPASERALVLFKGLVERYLADGRPVGSLTLSRELGLGLSPATIRNIMADLERVGLIAAPHTSAGRVPTQRGLRVFVDALLTATPFDPAEVERLRGELRPDATATELVESATNLLAGLSRQAGVVLLPRGKEARLKHLDLVPLSEHRLLVVLVTQDAAVRNWVVQGRRRYTESELQQAANYLTQHYAGQTLPEMRAGLLAELRDMQAQVNSTMSALVEVADQLLPDSVLGSDYVIRGESNLLTVDPQAGDMERLRALFRAFGEKRELLALLDQCMGSDGIQIFIGAESGYAFLDEYSVVTAPYEVSGRVMGVLGVIGPTRMSYEKVVALVDVTSRLLGAALNRQS
jgi:heat-inducible transcriptional repressor